MKKYTISAFPIINQQLLCSRYREYLIKGVPDDEHLFENLQKLRRKIAYDITQPVALVKRGDDHLLAIPADSQVRTERVQLIPDVAVLEPRPAVHELRFAALDDHNRSLAHAFLQFALKGALLYDQGFWSIGSAFYFKEPLNARCAGEVDVFRGFDIRTVEIGGRLCAGVGIIHRYIDRVPLTAHLREAGFKSVKDRRALYLFGEKWFFVRILADLKCSIKEAEFTHEISRELCNVFDFTKAECKGCSRPFIEQLDPSGPALEYENLGNKKKRKGAFDLARLAYATDDGAVGSLHPLTMLHPEERFRRAEEWARRFLTGAHLGSAGIELDGNCLEVHPRQFFIPDLRYGKGRTLHVRRSPEDDGTSFLDYGRKKKGLLYSEAAGPICTSFPKEQFVFIPDTLRRPYLDTLLMAVQDRIQSLTTVRPAFHPILYELDGYRTVKSQLESVTQAVRRARASGYGLFILGEKRHRHLHNFVKQDLWPELQFQCVDEAQLTSYFPNSGLATEGGPIEPRPDVARDFQSYVENVVFGLMIVNQVWLFALAQPTHFDVHIGIDVLNHLAGFSFVFQGGRKVLFHGRTAPQKERLERKFIRETLYAELKRALPLCCPKAKSILFQRDGNCYGPELAGIQDLVKLLRKDNLLAEGATYDVVEVRKRTSLPLRMAMIEASTGKRKNPEIGRYLQIGEGDGLVWTTGRPFQFRGTSNPLLFRLLTSGDREHIAEDLFSLAQLTFPAPDKCMRLPITLWLNDFFLEAGAGVSEKMRRGAEQEEEGAEETDQELSPALAEE